MAGSSIMTFFDSVCLCLGIVLKISSWSNVKQSWAFWMARGSMLDHRALDLHLPVWMSPTTSVLKEDGNSSWILVFPFHLTEQIYRANIGPTFG